MDPLSKVLRTGADGALYFWCLGCDMPHCVMHGAGGGPRWTWNGDADKPTLSPSVLVQWDHLSPAARERNAAFYQEHGRYMTHIELPYDVHHVCHTFVRDGRIEYLGDCTHDLVNQTIDLPEFPEGW
ncbi:DUF6527 family protein [Azohydromonas lata]|uniref:DUF6527 family protein n=1 Tax=Azohydromonas lata TaxID=45677 RepID=UPI000832ADF8|nr:DUF6527 family protein [Azohydromonas lata]